MPGPATTFSTPSGRPASSAIFSSSSAVSGVSAGGLEHDRVAGGERGRDLPGGDHQREVPGHDQPDDAERLAEGHVDAAGDRDRVAEQALGGAGVVAEGLDHHPDLAARVGDRLAGVARLERRELLRLPLERLGESAQQSRRGPPGATARQLGNARFARATAASTSSTPARGSSASTCSVAGSITSICGGRGCHGPAEDIGSGHGLRPWGAEQGRRPPPGRAGRRPRDALRRRARRRPATTATIDTVVTAFTDMQGRLFGKRIQIEYFLERRRRPRRRGLQLPARARHGDGAGARLRDRQLGGGLRRLRDRRPTWRPCGASPGSTARRSSSATSSTTTAAPCQPRRARC